jgi:hypothetical protein
LRIKSGTPVLIDPQALESAIADPDTLAGVRAVAPSALDGVVPAVEQARYLGGPGAAPAGPTLGEWGAENRYSRKSQ